MIWQNFLMALASIRQAKLRSALTMLGIIIGVSSVVQVLAMGEGLKRTITDQVSSLGANLLQVTPGQAFGSGEEGGASINFAAAFGSSTLTEQDVDIITKTPNVARVAPLMFLSGVARHGDNQAGSSFLVATTEHALTVMNRQVAKGSFLNASTSRQPVLVLGAGSAKSLFGSADPLNQSVLIRNVEFKVIGVMVDEEGEGFDISAQFDNMIYLPFEVGKQLNNNTANITEIDVQASSAESIDQVVTDIKAQLKQAHGGEEDFTVATAEDQLKVFEDILGVVTTFIAAIAGISLLVGGVGVMNIMFVSVTERTREIGIRKAIGATNRQILIQFLIESVVLSLIGGLLGIAAAVLLGLLAKAATGLNPVFSVQTFVLAVAIATTIGVVFGTAPAIKAARKNPIESLRYE